MEKESEEVEGKTTQEDPNGGNKLPIKIQRD